MVSAGLEDSDAGGRWAQPDTSDRPGPGAGSARAGTTPKAETRDTPSDGQWARAARRGSHWYWQARATTRSHIGTIRVTGGTVTAAPRRHDPD